MASAHRIAEIKSWLRRRLTPEEAHSHYAEYERDTMTLTGSTGGWVDYFEEVLASQFQPGDEFWLYDAGPDAWANLHGEKGMALVRSGEVIAFIMESRN